MARSSMPGSDHHLPPPHTFLDRSKHHDDLPDSYASTILASRAKIMQEMKRDGNKTAVCAVDDAAYLLLY